MPEGFEDSVVRLAQKARPAQKRIQKRVALMSPMDLGQEMREKQATTRQAEEARKTATEQLIHASGRVPKKARTRLAMMRFSGPAARQDAERAEKSRWLAHLATLLVGTQTPLGRRLVEKPAACNSMGLGLRSGRSHQQLASQSDRGTATSSQNSCPRPNRERNQGKPRALL